MRMSWKRSWLKLLQLRAGRITGGRTDRRPSAVRLLVETLEDRTVPSVLMVTNTHDTNVSGDGSLRGEILAAQDGDTIEFSSKLKGKTITLTRGDITIDQSNITIQATTADKITISGIGGVNGSRLFEIASSANVTISNLTLEKGYAAGSFTGGNPAGQGGAILDQGTLILTGDVIKGNTAIGSPGQVGQGGGVYVDTNATLTMTNSALMHNTAQGFTNTGEGGALYFAAGSHGTLGTDAIASNTATGGGAVAAQGGGLFATGANLTINLTTTITDNLATGGEGGSGANGNGGTSQGGGLYLQGGTVMLDQSTIAGNAAQGAPGGTGKQGATGAAGGVGGAGLGGGLYVTSNGHSATISITADTFSQNDATGGDGGLGGIGTTTGGVGGKGGAGAGGAVLVDDTAGGVTVNLTNDTIAANVAEAGVGGTGGGGPAGHGGAGGVGGSAGGGGIWANGGAITLVNDTIAGASTLASKPTAGNNVIGGSGGFASSGSGAQAGGGIGQGGGLFDSGGTFMTLKNTIVANNSASSSDPDVSGSFTGGDHNLIGDTTGSSSFGGSDLTGVDPHLSDLGFHGGPTETMVPIGGPAIDAADDGVAPAIDQRGVARPQGAHDDIGAVEVANLTFTIVSGNSKTAAPGTNFKPLVVEVRENGQVVAGLIIDFTVVHGGNGAGGKLKHAQVATNSKGQASATVTANSKAGTFTVTANVGGLPTLTFNLRNS